MSEIRHYLVIRGTTVCDYGNDGDAALDEYGRLEFLGYDCVLLGADSPETLRQTHGNWLIDPLMVREPASANRESGGER